MRFSTIQARSASEWFGKGMRAKTPSLALRACIVIGVFIAPNTLHAQDDYDGQIKRTFTEPIQRSIVSTNEIGIVRQITINEGDYVKLGQTLGRLNDVRQH